jgi:hypothetical protein
MCRLLILRTARLSGKLIAVIAIPLQKLYKQPVAFNNEVAARVLTNRLHQQLYLYQSY